MYLHKLLVGDNLVVHITNRSSSMSLYSDITIPPKSLNISLNEVAEFNCTAVANAFVWRKNRMDITTGITTVVVDQVQSVGMSTLRMTVSSLMDNAANITCTAVKSIPFSNDESEPALLLIQGCFICL